jgi:hypothetical protein
MFHTERFDLKELDVAEVTEQYQVKMWIIYSGLGNLDNNMDINEIRDSIRENLSISAEESQKSLRVKAI